MTDIVTAGAVETGAIQPDSKRPKLNKAAESETAALDVLLQHADRLRRIAKELKTHAGKDGDNNKAENLEPGLKRKLIELSQTLIPALNILSEGRNPQDELASLTKFTSADVQKPFLPLPEILDPELEMRALTHAGMVGVGDEHLSYERMEWMGDAYLEVIASSFINKTFPLTTSGQCAQHREVIVRNQTLAQYTIQYGLDKRARVPIEFARDSRLGGSVVGGKERTKVYGDLFEAWIGAVVVSDPHHGIARAAEFLKPLWARALQKHIQVEETRQAREVARTAAGDTGPERSPKEELLIIIGVNGVKVEYKDILTKKRHKDADLGLEMFTVGCYLFGWGENGKELGIGTAKSKKDAGRKAAQVALANKKLMKYYGDKKKAFLEVRAQEAALAELAAPEAPALDG